MDGWSDRWMEGQMDRATDGWRADECIDEWTIGYIYGTLIDK